MKNKTISTFEKLRKSNRPNAKQYIDCIFEDFIELSGDRISGDDSSLIGGIGLLDNSPVTIIAQLRGNSFSEQIKYNYSMTLPEGFRKSLRLMKQAEKFRRPVICIVDTIGAFPGELAEMRGQSVAIANNISELMYLKVPIISILIGNGGSGGALALCIADRVISLECAVLSVISPKACATLLWKDASKEKKAFSLLKMTSSELQKVGIVDYIISESNGKVDRSISEIAIQIKEYLINELNKLNKIGYKKLISDRQKKY